MKLRKIFRKYPIPCCIAAALSVFLLLGAVSLIRRLLPDGIPSDLARQILNILWPLLLTLLLGYGWCYRKGHFGKTLLAGLFALILFSSTFLIRFGEAVMSDETSWKAASGICIGVLNILGIGFREETIFRGVIANDLGIVYGKTPRGVWKAVILSGLIFGLVHLTNIISGVNPLRAVIQVVSACALGMYYTAIYFRGGNLWALVLIHCLTDAGGLFRSAFTTAATAAGVLNDISITGMIMIPVYIGITIFILRRSKMDAVIENLKQAETADRIE